MEIVIIAFLSLSLLLYCLLGGADFGAGVLEIFIPKKFQERYQELIVKAMGPVWEANHIWLIILIVILFNGFPVAYAELSIYFHIPLTLMLIGIIFRGSAFTFRHYDAIKDRSRDYYTFAFSFASVLTPITFGMIVGGVMLGRADPDALNYYDKYVSPWFNVFSLSVGLFVLSIFAFLTSVFLIGETTEEDLADYFIGQAKIANLWMVGSGALVFIAAMIDGFPLTELFFKHPVSIVCFVAATLSLFYLRNILKTAGPWFLRAVAGFQLSMILGAWFGLIFPNILYYKNGVHLTLWNTMGPKKTIDMLGWALILGTLFFLPALFYLLQVFKIKGGYKEESTPEQRGEQ